MKKAALAIIAISTITLTGCGKSAPKCGDSDTTNLIMQLVKPEILKGIALAAEINYGKTIHPGTAQFDSDDDSLRDASQTPPTPTDSLDSNGLWHSFNALAQQKYDALKPALSNIRTDSTDDQTQKATCSADLVVGAKSMPVHYSISKTTEGKLYGEIVNNP